MNHIILETKNKINHPMKYVRLFPNFAVGAILLAVTISSAPAQTVPNADFYLTAGNLTANGIPETLTDNPVTSSYGSLGSATAEITQGLDPYVMANATLTTVAINDGFSVDASAEYIYYFGFNVQSGNSTTKSIPIDVSAQGSASGNFSASIQLYHQLGTIRDFGEFTAGLAGYPTLTPTSTAQSVSIPANQIEEVILLAGNGGGAGSAYVDPQISIDPTFLADNPGYSLVFSPNFEPAPEPGVSGLFALGLTLAGLFGFGNFHERRIRRNAESFFIKFLGRIA